MGDTISFGQISQRVGIQAVARLLANNYGMRHTARFGMAEKAKRNAGDTIKWRRYLPFPVNKAPLVEGIPPSAIPLTWVDYTAILQEYGAVSVLTKKAKDLHEDDLFRVAIDNHGELMGETLEVITWDVLTACTNKFYASSVANRAAIVNAVSHSDFALVERALNRANAKRITQIVGPTTSVSTRGVKPCFIALCHTDLEHDIAAVKGYVPYVEYGTPGSKLEGELGAVGAFRVVTSTLYSPLAASGTSTTDMLTNGAAGTGACDVYQIVCLARDAYGTVKLQGEEDVGLKVIQPEQLDSGNRLGQKGSVGWLVRYAAAIVNMQWIAVLECACRSTPL